MVIAIAITVFAAVFASMVLPALTGRAPEVLLPDVNQETVGEEGKNFLPVEVTPRHGPERHRQPLPPGELLPGDHRPPVLAGGQSSDKVEIWADGDYVRTANTVGGITQYRLVGEGKLRLWYAGDQTWRETDAGDGAADLAQRIPTYEDVLELEPSQITDAGYEEKNGKDCIYVEVAAAQDNRDRYWIENATGLLCAAESYEGEEKVYEMTEAQLAPPGEGDPLLPARRHRAPREQMRAHSSSSRRKRKAKASRRTRSKWSPSRQSRKRISSRRMSPLSSLCRPSFSSRPAPRPAPLPPSKEENTDSNPGDAPPGFFS